MSIATPRHDVRRTDFPSGSLHSAFGNLLPSPYTPFSGQQSGCVPTGSPQLHALPDYNPSPPEPVEEAERFVDGDLLVILRGVAIDSITATRKMSVLGPPAEIALAFVTHLADSLQAQLDMATVLCEARSLQVRTRNIIQKITNQLRLEKDTWSLLKTAWQGPDILSEDLCTRRLAPSATEAFPLSKVQGLSKLQRIVEWLEATAYDALERTGGPQLRPLEDPAYRWEYTSSRVSDNEPISMDYPLRSGEILDEVEQKAETRLSREIYRLVRAGRLDEAEEACRRVGQPWRAALLAGGKRGFAISANGKKHIARKTWRKAVSAIALSSNSSIPIHERAVCGVLAGILEPVLAVADGFDDEAWARSSILLDATIERVMSGVEEVVKIEDTTILQAFSECQHSGKGTYGVEDVLLQNLRSVQAYVGLGPTIDNDGLKALMRSLAQLSNNGLKLQAEWACRFAAQVCLFVKFSGLLSEPGRHLDLFDNFDAAVQSYVRLVIKMDLEKQEQASKQGTILPARPLVCSIAAQFLAELSVGHRIVETYSELLCAALRSDIDHEKVEQGRAGVAPREIEERRTLCLKKAGSCFSRDTLNELVIAAVDDIWRGNSAMSSTDISPSRVLEGEISYQEGINIDDEVVVRAIEFLLFPAFANYNEALLRGTHAARKFFLLGKRGAAKHLITWFPEDILEHVDTTLCEGAIHEFDCWRAYLSAIDRHGEWSSHYTSKRPQPLPENVRKAAVAEPGKECYADQTNAKLRLEEYFKELESYKRTCEIYRDAAVESLRIALLYDRGWMVDVQDREGDDAMEDERAQRRAEIAAVRRYGIPQLTMLLHHVLEESGMYEEAVELAELIAQEELRLYECFGTDELKTFLGRIANSAVLLADGAAQVRDVRRPYEGKFFEEIL